MNIYGRDMMISFALLVWTSGVHGSPSWTQEIKQAPPLSARNNLTLETREASQAAALAASWGFSTGRQILTIAGTNETVDTVFEGALGDSLVVAVLGEERPKRRSSSADFVVLEGMNASLASALGLKALNRAMKAFESATGRHFYPFKIIPTELQRGRKQQPYAVWDVSKGEFHIDHRILERSYEFLSANPSTLLERFADAVTHQMGLASQGQDALDQEAWWSKMTVKVLPAALAAAFATQIPLWFCIACPIVLGLLAPFAFNFGFGTAAGLICQHYQLPTQECNDLWYGAFALAMVLSLASAIPIVYICQLPKCGRSLSQ